MNNSLIDLKVLTETLTGPRDKSHDADIVAALTKAINDIVAQTQYELKLAVEKLKVAQEELELAKKEVISLKDELKQAIRQLPPN